MATNTAIAVVFVLLAAASCASLSAAAAAGNKMVMEPDMEFESDAGMCEHWRSDKQEMMMDARMEAARLTLRVRGLLLPKYSDSSLLIHCTRGFAMMGMILPMGMHRSYRMIEKGQIVAVPKGIIFWFYNMGRAGMEMDAVEEDRWHLYRGRRRAYRGMEEEDCEMVMFADTSMEGNRGQWTRFSLAGAHKSEMGGIMHGFSKDMLAAAWDVSEEVVEQMVHGQDATGMVRLSKDHPFHDLMCREASMRRMRGGMGMRHHGRRVNADDYEDMMANRDMPTGSMSVMHFMYDMERSTCDHFNSRGGCMTLLNRYRLPVLKWMRPHSGMGAAYVRLEPEAMIAPGYMGNGHQMVYCMRGSMRVQVVKPNGDRWCDEEMQEGDMMMIPMGHPVMKKAGSDGCHFISFMTTDMAMPMFMAGRDSVLAMMPRELLMAAFGVDEKVAGSMMEQRRAKHAAILAPGRMRHMDSSNAYGDNTDVGMMEAVLQSLK